MKKRIIQINGIEVRTLAEAYRSSNIRYAKCDRCREVFVDDILLPDSILCPNDNCIGFAVTRGYVPEQVDEIVIRGPE